MTLALLLFLPIFLNNETVNCPELAVVVCHDNTTFRHMRLISFTKYFRTLTKVRCLVHLV